MILLPLLLFWQSHLDRAQSLLREQKLDEAAAAVAQALAEQPSSVPALLLQGRLAIARNEPATARSAFTRAVELAPDNAQAHFLLGFFHYIDNDFSMARPPLERARRLNPKDARTALFLALTFEGLALNAEAEAAFQQTLALEARRPNLETHVAYARMLFSQGRFDDARALIAKALSIDPKSRDALYEQARIAFEQNRDVDAIAAAKAALDAAGNVSSRQIHFLLSRAYARFGDTALARKHRQLFEAIPPPAVR